MRPDNRSHSQIGFRVLDQVLVDKLFDRGFLLLDVGITDELVLRLRPPSGRFLRGGKASAPVYPVPVIQIPVVEMPFLLHTFKFRHGRR